MWRKGNGRGIFSFVNTKYVNKIKSISCCRQTVLNRPFAYFFVSFFWSLSLFFLMFLCDFEGIDSNEILWIYSLFKAKGRQYLFFILAIQYLVRIILFILTGFFIEFSMFSANLDFLILYGILLLYTWIIPTPVRLGVVTVFF